MDDICANPCVLWSVEVNMGVYSFSATDRDGLSDCLSANPVHKLVYHPEGPVVYTCDDIPVDPIPQTAKPAALRNALIDMGKLDSFLSLAEAAGSKISNWAEFEVLFQFSDLRFEGLLSDVEKEEAFRRANS